MQFNFSELRKAIQHRMDKESVQVGCFLGADSSGKSGFDAAWHRRLREEQDDGTHGQIVE